MEKRRRAYLVLLHCQNRWEPHSTVSAERLHLHEDCHYHRTDAAGDRNIRGTSYKLFTDTPWLRHTHRLYSTCFWMWGLGSFYLFREAGLFWPLGEPSTARFIRAYNWVWCIQSVCGQQCLKASVVKHSIQWLIRRYTHRITGSVAQKGRHRGEKGHINKGQGSDQFFSQSFIIGVLV